MFPRFRSLRTLESVDDEKIELLRQLDIANLGDLLAYPPIRHAGLIRAAADSLLRVDEVVGYLDEADRERPIRELVAATPDVLRSVGVTTAEVLARLGVATVAELAQFPPFVEAEEIVTRAVSEESDPDAPSCVLPTCRKFTRNSKAFASFFKQEEIRDLSVTAGKYSSLLAQLFRFTGGHPAPVVYLGYSVSYLQDWIYGGVHLGEPQGSVSLFMGQDTQVSVLDWRRAVSASRSEDTQAAERLSSTLFHQRAVDEVARATAEEHQYGGTTAAGANAATAGSFVAAGAVVGGVGGGVSGALAGLVLGGPANAAAGAPTLAGAAVGTAVGSIAGAAAGSLIASGATTLGFVETDAAGDREVVGRSAQNIQQRTVQNSSSLRSFWSNVVSQNVQEEEQRIRTDRVTNHNRIHALNALYFEVLNSYRVTMTATGGEPILFLPFKPFYFTDDVLARYWWIIRTVLADPALVLDLDKYFLTVSTETSPAEEALAPPPIDEIRTRKIEVELNLDGSAMEELLKSLLIGAGLTSSFGLLGLVVEAFRLLFDAGKRDKVTASVITSVGAFDLTRSGSPNDDPNFVGRYSTDVPIEVESIEAIEIRNGNDEFSLSVPGTDVGIDINELIFEGVAASLKIQNMVKLKYKKAVGAVELATLEGEQTLSGGLLSVGANRAATVAWPVADQLRALVDGVDELVAQLEAELADAELAEARRKNLLSFLNANRFGFTRLILQSVEREQLTAVLETVTIGGVDLSEVAGTTPIGFCGGHVVLPLRNRPANAPAALTLDTDKLVEHLARLDEVPRGAVAAVREYANSARTFIQSFLATAGTHESPTDRLVLSRCEELAGQLALFEARAQLDASGQLPEQKRSVLAALEQSLRTAVTSLLALIASPEAAQSAALGRLRGWYTEVQDALKKWIGKVVSTDDVSLPSPAVFMEPVLSQAKGAELYDMRRNSHYEILPAPGIAAADPNVLRGQDPALIPTLPPATLNIQNAPELPLPASLTAALAEAGQLDLGALVTSNAGTLGTTLSSLSAMATELAKASAQLTGQAQQQALSAAGDVAKQVGELLQSALQTPAAAPIPTPPQGQQEKAEVAREVRRTNSGEGSTQEKTEEKQAVGAPVTPAGGGTTIDVAVVLTALVPSDAWELTYSAVDVAAASIGGGGPLAVAASKGVRFAGGEQFILATTVTMDATTLVPVAGGLAVNAQPGLAKLFLLTDTESVSGRPDWFEQVRDGVAPFAVGPLRQATPQEATASVSPTPSGTRLQIRLAAQPYLPRIDTTGLPEVNVEVDGTQIGNLQRVAELLSDFAVPDIDAALEVRIQLDAGGRPTFRVTGSHDLFPEFRLAINGTTVYRHELDLTDDLNTFGALGSATTVPPGLSGPLPG